MGAQGGGHGSALALERKGTDPSSPVPTELGLDQVSSIFDLSTAAHPGGILGSFKECLEMTSFLWSHRSRSGPF